MAELIKRLGNIIYGAVVYVGCLVAGENSREVFNNQNKYNYDNRD